MVNAGGKALHPSGVTSSKAVPPVDGRTHASAGSEFEFPAVVPLTHTVSVSLKLVVEATQFPTTRLWAKASFGEDSDNKAIAKTDMILRELPATHRGEFIDTPANNLSTYLNCMLDRFSTFI